MTRQKEAVDLIARVKRDNLETGRRLEEYFDPLLAVFALRDKFKGSWRPCGVCLGTSPSWDGHDINPPCSGLAETILQEWFRGETTHYERYARHRDGS